MDFYEFKKTVLPHTLRWEAFYVNDPEDRGGETYRGISRVYCPEWGGWMVLDTIADKKTGITKAVNDALYESVALFYWQKYGQRYAGIVSPLVFIQCFDFAVNGGFSVRLLQECLNNVGSQLTVDNKLGTQTLHEINKRLPEQVASLVVGMRKAYIDKISSANPRFKDGWNNRINYFKNLIKMIA